MSEVPSAGAWAGAEALWAEAEAAAVVDIEAFLSDKADRGADVLALFRQLWSQRSDSDHASEVAITEKLDRLASQTSIARGREGEMIGRFTLVRTLGEGGAGVVYLAEERRDDLLHRVAIKLLHQPFHQDDEVLRSALHERRLLARLSHPSITRYYDSGLTDQGLFYVVVELVDGMPFTRFVSQHQLGIDDALALFEQIVQAVHYAHQNLVVHRDLKPSNILIETEHRLPKLLDFGIARDLQGRSDDELTQVFACTPAYASPEQLSGNGAIGTPSDLYSLGVVLYEIVFGSLPIEGKVVHPILRLERQAALKLPAISATTCALSLKAYSPGQRRDLGSVIARLLSFHPQDRYPSAAALAEDLTRIRQNQPIRYGQHTPLRRAWRLLSRHKAISAAVTTALLIGLVSAGTYIVQSRHLAQQASRLASVSSVLSNLLTRSDPLRRGNSVTLADTVKEMAPELLSDQSIEPDVKAQLELILGKTLLRLGELEQARTLLQEADAFYAQNDANSQLHLDVAADLAVADMEQGRYVEARDGARAVVDGLAQHFPNAFLSRAKALRILATSEIYADRDLGSAASHARQAVELLREQALQGEEEYLTAQTVWALALSLDNQLDTAAALQKQVLSDVEARYGADSGQSFDPRNNLARTWQKLGRFEEADGLLQHNASLGEQRFGANSPDALMAINNLALNYFRQQRFDQAEPLMRRVYEGRVAVLGERHPRTSMAASNWADAQIKVGKIEAACALSEQATRALQSNPDATAHLWGYPAKVHARCRAASGDVDGALTELGVVIALWQTLLGEHHLDTLSAQQDQVEWLATSGQIEQALALATTVWQLRQRHYGDEHPGTREADALRQRLTQLKSTR